MINQLEGKRVLVTGAAGGIGLGIARQCANAGASVIVADINTEGAEQVASDLGGDARAVTLDVSEPSEIKDFFSGLDQPLDGVVNNAGVTIEAGFLEFPEEDLEKMWKINLRAVFCMCQQTGLMMKENGGGAIVNLSSVHGNASTPGYEMYAAVKAGVTAMTRAISWSLGRYCIRVNTLSPGLTHTEAVANIVNENPGLAGLFNARHASGRYATISEIGRVATFLLSEAAAAITGAEIVADHGELALLAQPERLVLGKQ